MNDTEKIRIILIDDHSKVHRGISAMVEVFDDLELVAHGSNGEEAIQLCAEYTADIVLMDVIMPGMGGVEATRTIRQNYPTVRVLALSSFQDDDTVRDMIKAGAIGYILKTTTVDDFAHTIRAAHAGKSVFSAEVMQALIQAPDASSSAPDYGLTRREVEVLKLMVDGLNNGEIAHALTISISTVKFHVSAILSKLHVTSRISAVALAVDQHLVS